MECSGYSEVFDMIRKSNDTTPKTKRAEFTKNLEITLMELICRNIRECSPADFSRPGCNSNERVRYGHTVTRKQRYRCKDYGKIYTTDSRRNLLSNSKLPVDVWRAKYCGCFVNIHSLRKSAMVCGVSVSTSFFMGTGPTYLYQESLARWFCGTKLKTHPYQIRKRQTS